MSPCKYEPLEWNDWAEMWRKVEVPTCWNGVDKDADPLLWDLLGGDAVPAEWASCVTRGRERVELYTRIPITRRTVRK